MLYCRNRQAKMKKLIINFILVTLHIQETLEDPSYVISGYLIALIVSNYYGYNSYYMYRLLALRGLRALAHTRALLSLFPMYVAS